MINEPERLITVCSECLQASCWHGEFMCERARNAGTVKKGERELERLALEHPSNYAKAHIERICGSTEYVRV
jgi:hypothetical protein